MMRHLRRQLSREHYHQLISALRLVRERHPQADLRSLNFEVARKPQGEILAYYHRPELIVYSPDIAVDDMLWVTVHEIGHYVDYHLAPGDKRFASETNFLDPFRSVAERSHSYQRLLETYSLYTSGRGRDQDRKRWYKTLVHLDYLRRQTEVWARAYTQWVLTGTEYSDEVAKVTNGLIKHGIHTATAHWLPHDYKPINTEMNRLLSTQLARYTIGHGHGD